MDRIVCGDLSATLWAPPEPVGIVYLHLSADEAAEVCRRCSDCGWALAFVEGYDFFRDLSPWPAEPVFAGREAFGGGADRYLRRLTSELIPVVETHLPHLPACRMVAGYSLGGLFSLYALGHCAYFDGALSVSGSLWYDGWVEALRENAAAYAGRYVYLSLGDREKRTKNARMARVENCTQETAELLRQSGASVRLEFNPGNHFAEAPLRVAKAIFALAEAFGN